MQHRRYRGIRKVGRGQGCHGGDAYDSDPIRVPANVQVAVLVFLLTTTTFASKYNQIA